MSAQSSSIIPIRCVVCDHTESTLHKRIPFWVAGADAIGKRYSELTGKDAFELVRCNHCFLIFLHPMPTDPDFFKLIYGFDCGEKTETEAQESIFFKNTDIFKVVEEHRGVGSVLDVGMGFGELLRTAQKRNWKTYGLELNPSFIDRAKSLGIGEVHCGTLDEHPFKRSFFDFINVGSVLEHVPDPRGTITKGAELLKAGGMFLLSGIPNIDGFYHQFIDWALGEKALYAPHDTPPNITWTVPYHLYYFSKSNLKYLIESCGFKIVLDLCNEPVMWEGHQNRIGKEVTDQEFSKICAAIKSDSASKQEKMQKYVPSLYHLLLGSMSSAILEPIGEIESALDLGSNLAFLAQKT